MSDPASTQLGRMLLDEITPVVMVLRTPFVEEACQKNGLSLVEMLRPFSEFSNIDVPVRTASDQPYRLQQFKLRLFYASDVRQPNVEVASERLKQVITNAGEKDLPDLDSDPPSIETILASQSNFVPSWFQSFNKELACTVSFSDHEAFDHPVTCLLVVSSEDEQPINKFVDLFNSNQLPSLLNDGAMDPKILKHYLLVHDNQDGVPERATKILTEMRSTFGSNDCQMLCINSSQDGLVEHQENPWVPYKVDASPSQHLGCFLTMDDLDELKMVMHDLSSKHIIPHMEQKIRDLNQQVSATRRGFRNQIKNLWWRKGKDDGPEKHDGLMYNFSSTESQIRLLGDYAFMLRDYELALSNYRLLSTDYKLDRAWKRYAGVQEMMGLTYFMLDQLRKEAEYCMENAFNTYLKVGSSGQRNASRCGLWWVEMLKTRGQYKEAATVYFRISGEEPLHSAVMLEQASYCYLLATPPMLRKYGFHLVLSGDLYKKCDQIQHAIRTYRNALSVFKGTAWNHIRDHVHFHIGKWYAFLGRFEVAMKHMLEVLACGHQSKTIQELFLRDFFQIVQKTGNSFEVSRLQLPIIDIPSLKVLFEDQRTYASPDAVKVRETFWLSLEEDMIPSLSTTRTNWLELRAKLAPQKLKESNICVAGETIKVDIGFKNPLQISVSLSDVSLVCEHSAQSNETEADSNSSSAENQNEEEFRNFITSREFSLEMSSFTLSGVDVLLRGGEKFVTQLTVTPRVEGILKIIGVRWKLSNSVIGFHKFEPNSMKKKIAKGRRKAKQSTDNSLKFLVIKSIPKLEGIVHHLPQTVYAGELRRLALELRNPSENTVKNMKMKISPQRFLNIGTQEDMNIDFPGCAEKTESTEQSDIQIKTSRMRDAVFLFPEDTIIRGGTPFLWPLWLHASAPGNISLYITIYYEIGDVSTVIKYRTLRMCCSLEVLPSLDVSFQISPCRSSIQEFLVRMNVINRTSSQNFHLHRLSSVGNDWTISLLQPVDAIFPLNVLMAGQAFTCFFKLKNGKVVGVVEENISTHDSVGDVRLSQGSNEILFDIHFPPLADFHNYERKEQIIPDQELGSTVDFILISGLERTNNSPDLPNSSILSHHACHCSIGNRSPIWWLLDGPRTVHHNFSASFCEIKLRMTLHNSSNAVVSIRINTSDSISSAGPLSSGTSAPSGSEAGWHDISVVKDIKASSDVLGTQAGKSPSAERVAPFIWTGAGPTRVKLEPLSSTDIPLQICVFSPGTYDLSNYNLHWNLLSSKDLGDDEVNGKQSSGTCLGHPFYISVLQQE